MPINAKSWRAGLTQTITTAIRAAYPPDVVTVTPTGENGVLVHVHTLQDDEAAFEYFHIQMSYKSKFHIAG